MYIHYRVLARQIMPSQYNLSPPCGVHSYRRMILNHSYSHAIEHSSTLSETFDHEPLRVAFGRVGLARPGF